MRVTHATNERKSLQSKSSQGGISEGVRDNAGGFSTFAFTLIGLDNEERANSNISCLDDNSIGHRDVFCTQERGDTT